MGPLFTIVAAVAAYKFFAIGATWWGVISVGVALGDVAALMWMIEGRRQGVITRTMGTISEYLPTDTAIAYAIAARGGDHETAGRIMREAARAASEAARRTGYDENPMNHIALMQTQRHNLTAEALIVGTAQSHMPIIESDARYASNASSSASMLCAVASIGLCIAAFAS